MRLNYRIFYYYFFLFINTTSTFGYNLCVAGDFANVHPMVTKSSQCIVTRVSDSENCIQDVEFFDFVFYYYILSNKKKFWFKYDWNYYNFIRDISNPNYYYSFVSHWTIAIARFSKTSLTPRLKSLITNVLRNT